MTVHQSASLIVHKLLPELLGLRCPALSMRRAAQQPRADLHVSPWPESREEEKFDRWKMLKCARDTGTRLPHQKGQNIAVDTKMDGQVPINTRRLSVTLGICNLEEICGLGKWNIGQVPFDGWNGK